MKAFATRALARSLTLMCAGGLLYFWSLAQQCSSGPALAEEKPRILRISGGPGEPMATWPSQGKPSGFIIEVLEEAARRSGYVLDWRTVPVLDATAMEANDRALRQGDVDLVVGVESPQRRREFLVTEPWWSVGIAALVRADSPIRQESDLRGKRLVSTPGVISLVASRYADSAIKLEPRFSWPGNGVEAVCLGGADAALMEDTFLRQVLLNRPPPCRSLDLRAIDLPVQLHFVLVYRKDTASAARALKSALDDITADGTLAAIAARHPPLSTPYAVQLAEAVRLRFARRTWAIGMAAALALALLGGVFTLKLSRSRRRLREANRRLQVDLDARVKAEAALRNSEARASAPSSTPLLRACSQSTAMARSSSPTGSPETCSAWHPSG